MQLYRYIAGQSIFHRLRPQIKILLCLCSFFIMFSVRSLPAMYVASIGLCVCLWQTRIPFKLYGQFILRLKWLFLFLAILYLFFLQQGEIILQTTWITIYSGALAQIIRVSFQLTYMMLTAAWLMYTTTPLELIIGIESYLLPLKRFGIKTERVLLLLFIVFRFIPILFSDFEELRYAQASRGAHIYEGNLQKRIQALPALFVPLFRATLTHATRNAKMLVARRYDCFSNFKINAKYLKKIIEYGIILEFIAILLAVLWFNYEGFLF